VAHIAGHKVAPEEVEEVCLGRFIAREGYGQRLILVGPTEAGRVLAIVLASEEEEGVYYPVTAYPASRKMRRVYQDETREKPR